MCTLKVPEPNAADIEFLRTELLTGLTLSKIALASTHADKTERNRVNARKAYDAVLHFMPRVILTEDEAREINDKLALLKTELQRLGEEI